jgi:hypothetical protein
MGVIVYTFIFCLCTALAISAIEGYENRIARLQMINTLKIIPFSSLAFDVEITCAICMSDFKGEDQVIQL